jgi:kinesin family protein 13
MNDKSSRAHTIFQIRFEQKLHKKNSNPTIKVSTICLVDLAGAEKLKSTGATGARAKEGMNINLSLTNLGICISALAENCSGKKKVVVPFRSSKLTFILKNMLGGNSKTVMIAAISPASVNYQETLSTLEYASRAKKIKTVAKVNEDENEKLIRQLKGQVADLEKQLALAKQGIDPTKSIGADPESEREIAELRAQLARSQEIFEEMQMSTEEKMKRTKDLEHDRVDSLKKAGVFQDEAFDRKTLPHLINLNEDSYMSEKLIYPVKAGNVTVGSKQGSDIFLSGLGVEENHCTINSVESNGLYKLTVSPGDGTTYVNGDIVTVPVELHHGSRFIFGSNYVFKLVNPTETAKQQSGGEIVDWAFAQKELMQAQFQIRSGPSEQELELKKQLEDMEKQQKDKEEAMKKEKLEMEKHAEEIRKKLELEQLEMQKKLQAAKDQDKQQVEAMKKQMEEQKKQMQLQLEQQRKELELKQLELHKNLEQEKKKIEAEVEAQKENDRQRSFLEERVAKLIPMVNEANSIAKKLKKSTTFELKILYQHGEEGNHSRSTVGIQVADSEGVIGTWNEDEFINRVYLMQELYQEYVNCIDSDTEFNLEKALGERDDPFEDNEALNSHQLIGSSRIFLKTLAHNIEFSSYTPILDFKGKTEGELKVSIIPLNDNSKSESEGADIEMYSDPIERVGDPVYFKIKVLNARGLKPNRCREVQIRYKFFLDSEDTVSEPTSSTSVNPDILFEKFYHLRVATKDFVQYLQNKMLIINVYGKRVLTEKQQQWAKDQEDRKKIDVGALLEKIRSLEAERDQVMSDLDLLQVEKTDLSKSNNELKDKIGQLEKNILATPRDGNKAKQLEQELQAAKLQLASQTSKTDGVSSDLEKKVTHLQNEVIQKDNLVHDLQKQVQEERIKIQLEQDRIKHEKELLKQQQEEFMKKQQEELLKIQSSKTPLEQELHKKSEEIESLKRQLQDTAVNVNQNVGLQNEIMKKLSNKEEEISHLRKQLDEVRLATSSSSADQNQLLLNLEKKNLEITEMRLKLEAAQQNTRNAEHLSDDLQRKELDISLLKQQLELANKSSSLSDHSAQDDLRRKENEILLLRQQQLQEAQQQQREIYRKDEEIQTLKQQLLEQNKPTNSDAQQQRFDNEIQNLKQKLQEYDTTVKKQQEQLSHQKQTKVCIIQ